MPRVVFNPCGLAGIGEHGVEDEPVAPDIGLRAFFLRIPIAGRSRLLFVGHGTSGIGRRGGQEDRFPRAMPKADFSNWVKPESIAKLLVWLASEAAADVSGAVIPIYGRA